MSCTGAWFRCDQPERPPDPYVRWHYHDCVACQLGASILLHEHPHDPHVRWLARQLGGPAQ